MSNKAPAFQFYPGDARRDAELHMMSFEARGVWWEMLCCMWDSKERGKLEGTPEQLCRLIGCKPEELSRTLQELSVTKTGDVTFCNDLVTVINRRMFREDKTRQQVKLRVARHRSNKPQREVSNATVTPPSSSSSSSSSSNTLKDFATFSEKWWQAYPSRNGKKVGKKEALAYLKSMKLENGDRELLLQATQNYSTSKAALEGFAKDPTRFLKKEFWRDWIEPEAVTATAKPAIRDEYDEIWERIQRGEKVG